MQDLVICFQTDPKRIESSSLEKAAKTVTLQKTFYPVLFHINVLPPTESDRRSAKVPESN